ncbi:MAG: hypothetical protein ABH871_05700 [Pseudomonadota bacterium]
MRKSQQEKCAASKCSKKCIYGIFYVPCLANAARKLPHIIKKENIMGDWTKGFPTWTAPVLEPMKQLDASDAKKNKPKLDGQYMGFDLVGLAKLYAKKYKTHQPGIKRVFDATAGLKSYVAQQKSDESSAKDMQNMHAMLVNALFEGVRAVLENRAPNYKNVPGFSSKLIDVEFNFYFNHDIYGKNKPMSANAWSTFWKLTLGDCRVDMFIRARPCPFKE